MAEPKSNSSLTSEDPFGVGMLADGKLNIVPPGELAARIAARNAEEAVEDDDPEEDPEDISDLDDD
jgi:hypothetical protein